MDVPAGKKADEKLPEAAAPEEEEEELPSGVMGRLERMLSLLEEDPKALAHCVFGHVRWLCIAILFSKWHPSCGCVLDRDL